MLERGWGSRGLLGAVFFFGFICLLLCLGMITEPRRLVTITVPSGQSFELTGKQRHAGHHNYHLHYVSKRRVPNGADPIHNRRAGKSTRPPVRA